MAHQGLDIPRLQSLMQDALWPVSEQLFEDVHYPASFESIFSTLSLRCATRFWPTQIQHPYYYYLFFRLLRNAHYSCSIKAQWKTFSSTSSSDVNKSKEQARHWILLSFFFYLAVGSSFPYQGLNPCALQWFNSPPGNSVLIFI